MCFEGFCVDFFVDFSGRRFGSVADVAVLELLPGCLGLRSKIENMSQSVCNMISEPRNNGCLVEF